MGMGCLYRPNDTWEKIRFPRFLARCSVRRLLINRATVSVRLSLSLVTVWCRSCYFSFPACDNLSHCSSFKFPAQSINKHSTRRSSTFRAREQPRGGFYLILRRVRRHDGKPRAQKKKPASTGARRPKVGRQPRPLTRTAAPGVDARESAAADDTAPLSSKKALQRRNKTTGRAQRLLRRTPVVIPTSRSTWTSANSTNIRRF